MHGAPFGEIARQSAPGAAGALQVENGTRHRTSPPGVRCAFTGTFQQGEERRWMMYSVCTISSNCIIPKRQQRSCRNWRAYRKCCWNIPASASSCSASTRAKSAVCWLMLTKFATKSKTTISISYASGIAGKRAHNIVLTNCYTFAAMSA